MPPGWGGFGFAPQSRYHPRRSGSTLYFEIDAVATPTPQRFFPCHSSAACEVGKAARVAAGVGDGAMMVGDGDGTMMVEDGDGTMAVGILEGGIFVGSALPTPVGVGVGTIGSGVGTHVGVCVAVLIVAAAGASKGCPALSQAVRMKRRMPVPISRRLIPSGRLSSTSSPPPYHQQGKACHDQSYPRTAEQGDAQVCKWPHWRRFGRERRRGFFFCRGSGWCDRGNR